VRFVVAVIDGDIKLHYITYSEVTDAGALGFFEVAKNIFDGSVVDADYLPSVILNGVPNEREAPIGEQSIHNSQRHLQILHSAWIALATSDSTATNL
jgi:hypothetical protein